MFTKKTLWKALLNYSAYAGASAFLAALLVGFFSAQISKTVDTVVQHRELAATLKLRSDVASTLSAEYTRIRGNEVRIKEALVPADDILEFVSALESLAQKNSITHAVNFGTPNALPLTIGDPAVPLFEIPFTLSLRGNTFAFTQYLKDFEQLPYFAKINGFSIASTESQGWLNASNISVRGTLYARGE